MPPNGYLASGLLLLLLRLCRPGSAIPIDNDVEGDPELVCGESSIVLRVPTRNPLNGHMFVKGHYASPECRVDADQLKRTGGRLNEITLDWYECGIQRQRSPSARGLFISVDVVVSFSPQFITKIDRVYSLQCFYMEMTSICETELNIDMLTTQMRTALVPMPVCRYEVLSGPTGQPIFYANIGQSVYHKWTCDSETEDIFCMQVHSCKVDDGNGDLIQLLDSDGCSIDHFLLGNLEYLTDLMAGKEAHVFKYADRPNLYFDCQITIVVKEPGQLCPRPACVDGGSQRRARRAASQYVDVVENVTYAIALREAYSHSRDWTLDDVDDSVCLGVVWLLAYAGANIIGLAASAALILSSCRSRIRKNIG